jgi:hypothetical protein
MENNAFISVPTVLLLTFNIWLYIIPAINMANDITAYNNAQPIQFQSLDQLLWGVVKTLQYFSLPVMALSIAALGIALIASGDDTERKSRLKGWIFNILIGGLLVFGAASLASILKQFIGGTN